MKKEVPVAKMRNGKKIDEHILKGLRTGQSLEWDMTAYRQVILGCTHNLLPAVKADAEMKAKIGRSLASTEEQEAYWMCLVANLKNQELSHRSGSQMPAHALTEALDVVDSFVDVCLPEGKAQEVKKEVEEFRSLRKFEGPVVETGPSIVEVRIGDFEIDKAIERAQKTSRDGQDWLQRIPAAGLHLPRSPVANVQNPLSSADVELTCMDDSEAVIQKDEMARLEAEFNTVLEQCTVLCLALNDPKHDQEEELENLPNEDAVLEF